MCTYCMIMSKVHATNLLVINYHAYSDEIRCAKLNANVINSYYTDYIVFGDGALLQMSTCSLKVMTTIRTYENLYFCHLGHGKTPKDAASVRATHPIPAACGVYYFEVKIISKGRDG